jgi:hypothetical protein
MMFFANSLTATLEPLIVLRVVGGLIGLFFFLMTFLRFRDLHISNGDALLRWGFGSALMLVAIWPGSISWVAATLTLKQAAYGRLLALLIGSTLLLWWLLFRERERHYKLKKEVDYLVRHVALQNVEKEVIEQHKGVSVLVAIPAWNEEEAVTGVLERMPEKIGDRDVLAVVIDDGSQDRTSQVVREAGGLAVRSPFQRGQGSALRIGYDLAMKMDAEIVVTLDADGQHQPEEVGGVIQPIIDGDSDLVIGSRRLGRQEGGQKVRTLGIILYNGLINSLLGTDITDCSSGFKAFRVEALRRVDFREDQYQSAEVIISCHKNRLRISEVPITITERVAGVSNKGNFFRYGFNFLRTIFRSWWR